MTYFDWQQDSLFAENLSVKSLAQRHGTPLYIYSKAAITDAFLSYHNALKNYPGLVCYAVKANSNLAILGLLAKLGSGFDIVSAGELDRVIRAGGDPQKVVFSGVGKTSAEMRKALEVGVHCFNVESKAELQRLSAVAVGCNKIAKISLRVNPDVDAKTHPYISTGLKENKFGIAINDALDTYRAAAKLENIEITGVDCHIGSQLTEVTPFLDAIDRLLVLIDQLKSEGIVLKHLDIGGGLGVTYQDETPPNAGDYLARVIEKIKDRNLELVMEPGRSIVANAGLLITQVEYLKPTADKNFAIVDAAMNDNIRPALYQAWQAIEAVEKRDANPLAWEIVGPVCETGDFLGRDRTLAIEQDDYLAMFGAGAYCFTMSSNYNSRPRACEIMVDNNDAHVIRERESFSDLINGETLLPGSE